MIHTGPVRRRPALVLAPLAGVVAVALAAACSSDDGRTLPPPDPDRTTTSVSAPVVGAPSESAADPSAVAFTLASPAFPDGGVIPPEHTCAGDDISPALSWTGVPDAVELAIVVRDRSANGFVHWVVTGIDPSLQGFGQGGLPEGAVEAPNSSGSAGWMGPCPPAGSGVHTYDFVLHALTAPVTVPPDATAEEAAALIEGASTAHATLVGTAAAT
jgi:Raf kinase inhibitor-like YbhB/YbcL family protein